MLQQKSSFGHSYRNRNILTRFCSKNPRFGKSNRTRNILTSFCSFGKSWRYDQEAFDSVKPLPKFHMANIFEGCNQKLWKFTNILNGWFIICYHLEYLSLPIERMLFIDSPKHSWSYAQNKDCKHSSESIELSNDLPLSVRWNKVTWLYIEWTMMNWK